MGGGGIGEVGTLLISPTQPHLTRLDHNPHIRHLPSAGCIDGHRAPCSPHRVSLWHLTKLTFPAPL